MTELDQSDEDRILHLMNEQSRLTAEIAPLQSRKREMQRTALSKLRHGGEIAMLKAQTQSLKDSHADVVRQLIGLLDGPLRSAFAGNRRKLEQAGVQYTAMVHDFFLKLMERRVKTKNPLDTFSDLRLLVAKVFRRQMITICKTDSRQAMLNVKRQTGIDLRDAKVTGPEADSVEPNRHARREYIDAVAVEAFQKRDYFQARYQASFVDFLIQLEEWEEGDDEELLLAARALLLHYVAGENWGVIAKQLNISDERLMKLRKMAATKFQHR